MFLEFVQDDYGFIRFDAKNCTPGKTIPCGNACRTPANCKSKGKARVSEKGKELRQAFADKIRQKRGMLDRETSNMASTYEREVLKRKPKKETLGMGPLAKARTEAKARSASSKKAAATRASAARSEGSRLEKLRGKYQTKTGELNARAKKALDLASVRNTGNVDVRYGLTESRNSRLAKPKTATARRNEKALARAKKRSRPSVFGTSEKDIQTIRDVRAKR